MSLKSKESSKNYRLTSLIFTGLVLSLASFVFLAGTTSVSAQTQIYDNGSFATGATTNSGVAAPAGAMWSEVQNPTGNTMEANSTSGISCSVTATVFRCADDFTVPSGATWTINQVVVFAYQTGYAGSTSPITAATLRIWNGKPGDQGSTIIFGDTTTNRLAASTDTNTFRVFNTVVGNGGSPPTAPGTTRRIWQNNLNVSPALVLTAGTYWIDWNTSVAANGAHFAPSATVVGTRSLPGWNAIQSTDSGATYVSIVDVGIAPTGAPTPPTVPQDFPFKLIGSVFAPTAASVSVSGRVRTPNGRGLTNAIVTLTDASGNQRLARTTAFGYFHFEDVSAGETYIVEVSSKRYRFASQVLSINQDVTDLELTGDDVFKSSR